MRTLVLAVVFATVATAGQPDPKPKGPPKEAWADTPEHTEFPELRITKPEDAEKLIAKLKANYPKPIPANGTPLEKVRTAQVNEGVAGIIRFKILIENGAYRPEEFTSFVGICNATFRVEAELLATPGAKIEAAERRVQSLSAVERFVQARVQSGADSPRNLNLARFERLQAETDLLLLKEQLAKEKGK